MAQSIQWSTARDDTPGCRSVHDLADPDRPRVITPQPAETAEVATKRFTFGRPMSVAVGLD